MTSNENQNWLKEYESFLRADNSSVPDSVNQRVLARMKELVAPSPWFVFAKVLIAHLVVGTLSLSVCHQFGINPFKTETSLADWFMRMWGHGACMIACGTVFVSFSFLAVGWFLSIEEMRALKRTEFLQTLAVGTVSLAAFYLFGAELAVGIGGLWLLGAILGGFAATQSVWALKKFQLAKAQ